MKLCRLIYRLFDDFDHTYGSPRLKHELETKGHYLSKSTVARKMQRLGLRALAKKKHRITTDSSHKYSRSPNLLAGVEEINRVNQVWASDITYIWTAEGWMYLCVVLDLYSRKVVGWSIKKSLRAELVIDALLLAIGRRNPKEGLIFHSDQGIQYACDRFRAVLRKHGFNQSMSAKGNCYDNAYVESFFHSFKIELIYPRRFETREELVSRVFRWIEYHYNRRRLHSALGYLPPEKFEQKIKVA